MVVLIKYNSSCVKDMSLTTDQSYPSTYAQDFPDPTTTAFLDFRDPALHFRTIVKTLKMGTFLLKSLDGKFRKVQVTTGNHFCWNIHRRYLESCGWKDLSDGNEENKCDIDKMKSFPEP